MRQFSESVQTELNKKHGLETVLYVGVKWSGDNEVFYSSNDVEGATKALLSIDQLETTSKVEGNGTSQSVTVTLSDTDGKLTEILNTIDIHKRPAAVYLGFPGVPIAESLPLVSGEINTTIEWDEATRTLTFTILSSVEGRTFGFAAEDGQFGTVDPSQRTAPWPFRFGYTCAFPAVKIGAGIQGFLRAPQGVVDPTLDLRLCQVDKINCPAILTQNTDGSYGDGGPTNRALVPAQYGNPPAGTRIEGPNPADNPFQRYFVGLKCDGATTVTIVTAIPDLGFGQISGFEEYDPEVHGYQFLRGKCMDDYTDDDKNCQRNKRDLQCQLLQQKSDQEFWAKDTLTVAGGEDFPQDQPVTILVGSVLYEGSFSGETFTITSVNSYDPTDNPDCEDIPEYRRGWRIGDEPNPTDVSQCNTATGEPELKLVGGAGEGFRRLEDFEGAGFTWLPSGTTVTLQSSSTEVHIVSLTPGIVLQVMAYRTVGDLRLLTQLPTDYYEVVTVDYGDFTATEVHLTRPLSSYAEENWDSQVYATFQSTIESNPVDVIEWIAERYTDLTIDDTSFNIARARILNKYPCNYYYAEKRDVFSVITQIAYEARCALSVTDGLLKITYLPYEPDSLRTLTDADVVAKSLSFSLTDTEDLITSSQVTYKIRGAPNFDTEPEDFSLTVEKNVSKYGTFTSSRTYDTITNEAQALKTATFWSIRDSETYKLVELSVTLEHADLEVFDCVTLNVSGFPNTKAEVREVTIEPETGVVRLKLWTPILSGTDEPYFFAWPANIPAGIPYPTNNLDLEEPEISMTPPPTSPLFIPDLEAPAAPTTGDRFPSDLSDAPPENICYETSDADIISVIQPQFEEIDLRDAAESADNTANQNYSQNVGLSVSFDNDEDLEEEDDPENNDICMFEVIYQYGTAESIAEGSGSGFSCDILPGPCKTSGIGARCSGPTVFRSKFFGNEDAALAAVSTANFLVEQSYCSWTTGKFDLVSVTGPFLRNGSDCTTVGGIVSVGSND